MTDKLVVRNLNIAFGEKQVLKNVSITFPDQKIVALIGPSGCGKSTLLRSLNRMHDLTPQAMVTGEVLLDGHAILGAKVDVVDVRRKVGMVFQKPNLFPKSIFENVAYGLKVNKMGDKNLIRARVEEAIKSCYLWDEVGDRLDKPALELSGGQQQRLCIARAIAIAPEVILMDEPCAALDPISTLKIEELMLGLREKFAVVIVTHNMQQALRVADSTAFMYLGELIEYGPTTEIFNHPQHELTQRYIQGAFG
ncbi:MAG TPA: phosphate ABC transporter ATP-binding protein PstB [Rhodothermales bacterium]|nr:phosphate ABC transporter ATP-binding protein [Bacteroidota bacterium]HRK72800.1 phosphate ABC transporter ATP-binding protein PstB [Rhodothermales bacterium]HRR07205.1 phosphate ABC transporter ATP-binding protein PstB [Rhodothermales bacterium]